jgi:hypothetical protein
MGILIANGVSLDWKPPDDLWSGGKVLPIVRVTQKGELWCWAACVESLTASRGERIEQQEVVRRRKKARGIQDCPDAHLWYAEPPPPCDYGLETGVELEAVWRGHGFANATYRAHQGPLPDQDLVDEIAAGAPVQAFGGEHYVLVYGWRRNSDGTLVLLVMDPAKGSGITESAPGGMLGERGEWRGSTLRLEP